MMEWLGPKIAFLAGRKTDYRMTFTLPAGQRVLADLARFCRAAESCGVPGDRDRTFTLIGRNEVWLRINQHLVLSPEQMLAIYDADAVVRTLGGGND